MAQVQMRVFRIATGGVLILLGLYTRHYLPENAFVLVYGPIIKAAIVLLGLFLLLSSVRVLRPFFKAALALILLFLTLELPSALAFRIVHGDWHLRDVEQHLDLFDSHPYLVGVPKPRSTASRPGWGWSASHNSLGYRGEEFRLEKPEGVKRIVTLGGSTTWGTDVNNNETWPYQLGKLLGPGYEVINAGVPGYSSAEHVIQTALNLMDLKPDIAIYYMGWNELVNVHMDGTATDYSNYHGKSQYRNLDLVYSRLWLGPDFAFIRQFIDIAQQHRYLSPVFDPPIVFTGNPDGGTDQRVLSVYSRNVRELISLCRDQGIEPVFIPQVLNTARLVGDTPDAWTPLVRPKDMPHIMADFNNAMKAEAEKGNARFIGKVLEYPWKESDFVDIGHFTAPASVSFAKVVADELKN